MHLPFLPRAQVQWGWGKTQSKLTARSNRQSSWPGRGPAAEDRLPDFMPQPPLLPSPSPPGWAVAAPRYLRRSRAPPRSAPRNLNPCCGLLTGRPRPPARLWGARAAAAHSVRTAERLEPGRSGWSPGGAGWAVRRGSGQGAAPQRRAPPGPRSPRPPAGACARGERRAEGGARRERDGRREGRRERGGARASGAQWAPGWG